jgi:hypothetical protein
MGTKLKFYIILNANASGGKKLRLLNKIVYLLKLKKFLQIEYYQKE